MEKAPEKKIFLTQISIVAMVVLFGIIITITTRRNYILLKQLIDERAEEIMEELALLGEAVTGIQDTLTASREDYIVVMMAEKLSYDYAIQALKYFKESDYGNASATFSLALRYQQRNTTLLFYQIYSLYLRHIKAPLTENEMIMIQARLRELKERGFREQDYIDHTIEEMQLRVEEMEYNVEILRQRVVE